MNPQCPYKIPNQPTPQEQESLRERAYKMAEAGELKFLGFNDGLLQGYEHWPEDCYGHNNKPSSIDINDPIYQLRSCKWSNETGVGLILALDQIILLERIDRVIEVDNTLSGTVEIIRKAKESGIDPELAARTAVNDNTHDFKVTTTNRIFVLLCILLATSIGIVILDNRYSWQLSDSVIKAFSASIPLEIMGVIVTLLYAVFGKSEKA